MRPPQESFRKKEHSDDKLIQAAVVEANRNQQADYQLRNKCKWYDFLLLLSSNSTQQASLVLLLIVDSFLP